MPELPDLTLYLDHLDRRIVGEELVDIRLQSAFVLRTVSPSVAEVKGRRVTGLHRLAKQVVIELDGEMFIVIHLMISGRLRWYELGRAIPKGSGLAAFDFSSGTLIFTEVSKKKRASLKLVCGREALAHLNPGGLEVLQIDLYAFMQRLCTSNHTLKRTLTDQRIFAGIGNAYSDEILLRAKLSPFKLARDLTHEEGERLFNACRQTLSEWIEILRDKTGGDFPDKVTAFHEEMAAHGKYRQPCPVCGAPIQRIRHTENESNYCAGCQTGGRVLADRSLSRLLKDSWPKRIEESSKRTLEGRD